jgi:hypothetical protein
MGALSQGLKKPFAFDRQKNNLLKFKVLRKLKCLLIGLSCNNCKWVITKMQLIFNPILFVIPFKFVKYIIKCTKNIKKQVTFGMNQ